MTERDAAGVVLEARDRRLRRQARASHRVAPQQQLVDRVVGERVRIVAIGISEGDAEDPLADQILERVPDLLGRPAINQTPGKRLDQAIHSVGCLEQDGAAIRTCLLAVERGHAGLPNRSGNRTLCAIVGPVTQEPPSCQERLSPTAF